MDLQLSVSELPAICGRGKSHNHAVCSDSCDAVTAADGLRMDDLLNQFHSCGQGARIKEPFTRKLLLTSKNTSCTDRIVNICSLQNECMQCIQQIEISNAYLNQLTDAQILTFTLHPVLTSEFFFNVFAASSAADLKSMH
jgi:hypothetical protein